MSLAAILTAVNTTLTTNGTLSTTPGTPTLELAATPKRDRTVAPRVTWVPGRDRFTMANPAMTKASQTAYLAANPGKQLPKCLHIRHAGVEAHLWAGTTQGTADDYSATEALVQAVISAVHEVAYGCYELESSGWVNPRGTEGNSLGHRYVLNLSFLIPVLQVQDVSPAVSEVVTVTTVPGTNQFGPVQPSGTIYTNP